MMQLLKSTRASGNQHIALCLYLVLILFGELFPKTAEHFLYLSTVIVAALITESKYKATKHVFIVSVIIAFVVATMLTTDIYYKVALISLCIIVLVHSATSTIGFLGKSKTVSLNEILGLVNCYVIIGLTWALSYVLLEALRPESFSHEPSRESLLDVFISYSFATLTTSGVADVAPQTEFARRLSITESMAGQFYFALIVAYMLNKFSTRETQ
jgi:hypothetical protein